MAAVSVWQINWCANRHRRSCRPEGPFSRWACSASSSAARQRVSAEVHDGFEKIELEVAADDRRGRQHTPGARRNPPQSAVDYSRTVAGTSTSSRSTARFHRPLWSESRPCSFR